jgi:diguanylate cyclase (GGDEF)-like protein
VEHKDTPIVSSELIDLSQWLKFQEGLSDLLDTPITLFDNKGSVLAPPSGERVFCKEIKKGREECERCGDLYLKDIPKVLQKDQIHIFKCHINQYIFSVPVYSDKGLSFFIAGQLDFPKNEVREFCEAFAGLGFNEATFIFSMPNIVKGMAVPFLECLYSCGVGEKGVPYEFEGKTRLEAFHLLQEVSRSFAPGMDRQKLYETILSKSTELVGAEQGSLMILDNGTLEVKAARGIDTSIVENLRIKVGDSISGSIAKKGVPLVIKDIEKAIPSRKNRPRYKTKSFISIPLKMESKVVGVINISDKITGEVFSEDDLNIILSFSNYASIALEREAYYSLSEELKTISMTDSLTGLFNRRYFLQRLMEEIERVKRHDECFVIFIVDIDNFKAFNDKYGHLAGDEILKSTSRSIREAVRAVDVVSRIGGEEFGVILPRTNKEDSFIIADRIRKSVERIRLPEEKFAIKEGLTVSVGMAEYPYDAENAEELIHNADKAMYLAKSMGKNRVIGYER